MSSDKNKPQVEEEVNPEILAEEAQSEQQVESAEPMDESSSNDDAQISLAELIEQLTKAQETIEEQKDAVIRARAEVDNIRRRSAQDVEKAHKFALEKFANELLPVIDNMELALLHANHDEEALKPMIQGVELTLKTLLSAVTKFGIEVVDPMEQSFDPAKHQAMGMQEVEGVEPNTVVAVMQKGYELNGRLIRPAMVMIAKAPTVDTTA